MVYGLLADELRNDRVGPVDKETVEKVMGILAERLAAVQSIVLGEEQSIVAILVDAIL